MTPMTTSEAPGHALHIVFQVPGSRRVSGPALAGTEASPNRRCSTRLLSASVHQVRGVSKWNKIYFNNYDQTLKQLQKEQYEQRVAQLVTRNRVFYR